LYSVALIRQSEHASAALGDTASAATRRFQSIFAVNSAAVSVAISLPAAFFDHRTITPAAARQRQFAAHRRRSLTSVTHGYLHDALISAAAPQSPSPSAAAAGATLHHACLGKLARHALSQPRNN